MTGGYYNLGAHSRPVACATADAQTWFDRGLNWIFGFNHDEAKRCFERAIAADPDCAMAHWGLGYAHGPHVNKDWHFYADEELVVCLPLMHESAQRAIALSADGDPVEHALALALLARYPQPDPPDLATMVSWHDAFADAMRDAHHTNPDDGDVASVFVESMMMRTPWRLWDPTSGEVGAGASTDEMVRVLEATGGLNPADRRLHPGLLHMAIHTVEMSPTPERGLPAADALRNLVPDAGHLQHMPSHIDVLLGRYAQAVAANELAVATDLRYLAEVGPYGQYSADICHDNHLLMYAAMLMGRWQPAIDAADRIWALVTPGVLDASTPVFAMKLEGYASMRMHVFVRFGRWNEILAQPPPADPERYPVTTVMHHYATAIAHASLGDHQAAVAADRFEGACSAIGPDRFLFNNDATAVIDVARAMLLGEFEYHRGAHREGLKHLRNAVRLGDELRYTEPWAWMHPPRHALGALLLEQGQVDEAEQVYREDLGLAPGIPRGNVHPDNVWALHGLVECLDGRASVAEEAAVLRLKLDTARRATDVSVTSSCACRGLL